MADIDELLKEAPTLTFGTMTAPEERRVFACRDATVGAAISRPLCFRH